MQPVWMLIILIILVISGFSFGLFHGLINVFHSHGFFQAFCIGWFFLMFFVLMINQQIGSFMISMFLGMLVFTQFHVMTVSDFGWGCWIMLTLFSIGLFFRSFNHWA
jgi:hypothetical protein